VQIGTEDNGTWTALHWAAYGGNLDVATLLMRHGVSKTLRTVTGDCTPLAVRAHPHVSLMGGRPHVACCGRLHASLRHPHSPEHALGAIACVSVQAAVLGAKDDIMEWMVRPPHADLSLQHVRACMSVRACACSTVSACVRILLL
jgi:hypothetical protein